MKHTPLIFAFLSLFLPMGCASYKIPTESFQTVPEDIQPSEEQIFAYNRQQAATHWLYHYIPRHRSQIRWYDFGHWLTWMFFGNDDEGIFAEAQTAHFKLYEPVSFHKALSWTFRNPMHNFCFYVIGSAHRQNSEFTVLSATSEEWKFFQYLPQGDTVFAGDKTSFYFGFHSGKPFISLRLSYTPCWQSDFYFGWRSRGNFGIKFLPFHHIGFSNPSPEYAPQQEKCCTQCRSSMR